MEDGPRSAVALPSGGNARYYHFPGVANVGQKRNLCCELARGEIICHWDDDDWSYPNRITEQVESLRTVQVTGYHSMYFYWESTGESRLYRNGKSDYTIGTSLAYWRKFWQAHKFPEIELAEDDYFMKAAISVGSIRGLDGVGKMVAVTHSGGTSPRPTRSKQWQQVDVSALPWIPER